jgi:hypothetical protein
LNKEVGTDVEVRKSKQLDRMVGFDGSGLRFLEVWARVVYWRRMERVRGHWRMMLDEDKKEVKEFQAETCFFQVEVEID